jgi:hypothetical protein
LKNAEKHGYNIDVIESYIFEKDYNLFDNFVKIFYELKKNTVKNERLIYKLILNSLYGRFGMQVESDVMEIVTPEERYEISKSYPIEDVYEISKGIEIVKYKKIPDKLLCEISGTNYYKLLIKSRKDLYPANTSVAIAAAIASYGRIVISNYLSTYEKDLYYSDTDSLVLSKRLPDNLIGNELGDLKLEFDDVEYGVFITPKLYYMRNTNGVEVKKAKSIKNDGLTLHDYINLYNGNTVTKIEERWYSNLREKNVIIKQVKIDIHPQLNTRNKIYSLSK